MEFSRQEYCCGLSCPPPGVLPNPRIEPMSLVTPALAGGFFTTSTTWEVTSVGERDRERQRKTERRRGGEERREEKGRERKGRERGREVLSASILATGPQGKTRGDGCVLDCHLLRACFSARFLPLLQHLFPPSTDCIWTSGDYPSLWFFLPGPDLCRSKRFAHFTCGPLASLFYHPTPLIYA